MPKEQAEKGNGHNDPYSSRHLESTGLMRSAVSTCSCDNAPGSCQSKKNARAQIMSVQSRLSAVQQLNTPLFVAKASLTKLHYPREQEDVVVQAQANLALR